MGLECVIASFRFPQGGGGSRSFRTERERGEHALSGLKPERNLPWMGEDFFKILSAEEDTMMA